MERVLKGDTKAEFLQQVDLVRTYTVTNFAMAMAYMTKPCAILPSAEIEASLSTIALLVYVNVHKFCAFD